MKKRYIATTIGIGTTGIAVLTNYLLNNKKRKKHSSQHHILEEAGIPDQMDTKDLAQLENANMVSEGSQYGVNYYNEVKEAEHDKNIQ